MSNSYVSTNIISNIYTAPITGTLIRPEISNIKKILGNYVGTDLGDKYTILNDLFSCLTTKWLCKKYHMSLLATYQYGWDNIPELNDLAADHYKTLEQFIGNIPMYRHSRKTSCNTYIIGSDLYVLVRSCHEYN